MARPRGRRVLLIAAYGLGHCSITLAAGGSTGWLNRYLHWSGRSRATTHLRYVSGLLVLAAGVYLVYTARGA